MKPPDAVFFDMDGLLLDSERLWLETEAEVMAGFGAPWTAEHQKALIGGDIDRTVAYMLDLTGPVAPPGEMKARLLAGMADRLRTQVPLMPGAKDLLDEVTRANVPAALVSSTHRALMDIALDGIGGDVFAVTVAGDEVARTKPDPEPYLKAARLAGADPARCVVLEDSPNGVAAGTAAGCVVVAVPSLLPVPEAPRRLVVASLRELTLTRLRALF